MYDAYADNAALSTAPTPIPRKSQGIRADAVYPSGEDFATGNAGKTASGTLPLDRPAFAMTRDPAIVESVRRNGLPDVIGYVRDDGWAVVYRWSLERYRERLRAQP